MLGQQRSAFLESSHLEETFSLSSFYKVAKCTNSRLGGTVVILLVDEEAKWDHLSSSCY